MKFRTRLVLTLSVATAVTVASAFGAASLVVVRSEEGQLDDALLTQAHFEAAEMATAAAAHAQRASGEANANTTTPTTLHISTLGGPAADDIGHLKKFAVIYGKDDGHVVDRTASFARGAPSFSLVQSHLNPPGTPFDFVYGSDNLRGVLVTIPQHDDTVLLLAASRSAMEKDNDFLRQVMLMAALLSIGFTVLVTWRVVRRLTRGHEEIAEAARKVAAGDLAARVSLSAGGDDEVVQLAHDVDEMVRRLGLLVEGQQRFVAHAAHELRSPLTALYGELQLALRRSRSAEEYRAAIEEALDSARRLKALADDLLALARIGADADRRSIPQTAVSLDEVARNAASWVSREATRRKINLAINADDSTILGHAIDLERLLRNLLDNAVRHSPEGGHVRVRVEAKPITMEVKKKSDGNKGDTSGSGSGDDVNNPSPHHHGGSMVHVSVADDGPGIPAEDRDRVFDPFFRAATERRRDDGSGLGLAIVREIARGHGGDVSVEDGPNGKGTLFRARFPAAPAPPPATSSTT